MMVVTIVFAWIEPCVAKRCLFGKTFLFFPFLFVRSFVFWSQRQYKRPNLYRMIEMIWAKSKESDKWQTQRQRLRPKKKIEKDERSQNKQISRHLYKRNRVASFTFTYHTYRMVKFLKGTVDWKHEFAMYDLWNYSRRAWRAPIPIFSQERGSPLLRFKAGLFRFEIAHCVVHWNSRRS